MAGSLAAAETGARVVKMTLGRCEFATPGFACPCRAGNVRSTTGVLDRSALCETCGHLLSQHGSFVGNYHNWPSPSKWCALTNSNAEEDSPPRPAPQPCAVRFCDQAQYCPRRETVRKLASLLDEERLVHVRGTPASGKSLLANFLREYLIEQGESGVICVDDWSRGKRPLDLVLSACLPEGDRTVAALIHTPLVVIIDEAQCTYVDEKLWYGAMKSACGVRNGARFCIFSSYGSPTSGVPMQDYPASVTPHIFSPSQRVSLTVASTDESPGICLFFNKDEYYDVVERFCQLSTPRYVLENELQDYLLLLTNGHPGMVSALLYYVHNFYRSHLKKHRISVVTLNHIRDTLTDDHKLSNFLQNRLAGRALPSIEIIGTNNAGITDVLLNVLRDGHMKFDQDNQAINDCFRNGFVHTELDTARKMICVLPSPLHARFVEYSYGQYNPAKLSLQKYPGPADLCQAVLRRFSRQNLCQIRDGRRLGTSGQSRPFEAAFQDEFYRSLDEFYRSFWNEAPGAGISSECVVGGDGRVDFFIIDPGWGVELLRDGDRLTEHCDRFRPNGAYYADIQAGILKDWLVLDCRHPEPKVKWNVPPPRCWSIRWNRSE